MDIYTVIEIAKYAPLSEQILMYQNLPMLREWFNEDILRWNVTEKSLVDLIRDNNVGALNLIVSKFPILGAEHIYIPHSNLLTYMIAKGSISTLRSLLRWNTPLSTEYLRIVIIYRDIEKIRLVLKNISKDDYDGDSLKNAIDTKNIEIVSLLLDNGFDIDLIDNTMVSKIIADYRYDPIMMKYLIERGVRISDGNLFSLINKGIDSQTILTVLQRRGNEPMNRNLYDLLIRSYNDPAIQDILENSEISIDLRDFDTNIDDSFDV